MGYVEQMLGEHEHLVFRTHQHIVTLAPSLIGNLLLALILIVVAAFLWGPMGMTWGWVVALLTIIPVVRFIYQFLLWDNREYLITNRRVIQIDGIINKNVTDSSLEKVNDVKMSQSVLGRMLDYGDVEILTASELAPNLFRRIASPIKFKTEMLNQKEALGMGEGLPGSGQAGEVADVPALIAGLDQLRRQGLITEEEFKAKKEALLARI